jgi:hypothetical protein
MPSVTKLAIIGARNLESKLSARPKGTGTSEIPVTLYEIITEQRQIREKDKRRVGSSLTAMN